MKEKVIIFNSNDAASALRSAVAFMRRQMEEAGEKWNIVIVKSTIDHDASGIMETLLDIAKVCFAHCSTSRLALGSPGCRRSFVVTMPKIPLYDVLDHTNHTFSESSRSKDI